MRRVIFLFLLLLFASYSFSPVRTTELTGNAMTIDYRIVIGSALSEVQTQRIQTLITETFSEINRTYNKWNPQSELSILNRLPAHTPQQVSPQLYDFLLFTDRIVRISQGRFDPTIEPLQALWKQHLTHGTLPSSVEIEAIAPSIGWDKISLQEGFVTKLHDRTMLDLGGIAKGHAIDLLWENLHAEGFSNFYIEWGGEIRTHGQHPEKRPWKVYISHLGDTNPEHAIALVDLETTALATSGDYLQQWAVDQTVYFHVFDLFTLQPLRLTSTSIRSVSVAAGNCALADGLATAALTFSDETEAVLWLEAVISEHHPEVRYWLLSNADTYP